MPLPERKLVDRIRRMASQNQSEMLVAGIGDDSAVLTLPRRQQLLVSTDLMLERVHFRREWQSPEAVGHRVLLRGLSDIAAMGGEPFAAFLSLGLPPKTPQVWVDSFLRGFLKLAKRYGSVLAGGDVAASPTAITADVVVLGRLPDGTAILRSGARPGDIIYVTGALGAAAVRLRKLRSKGRTRVSSDRAALPEPRIAVGAWLRQNRLPSAMIDLSDGLSTDLRHVCEESGVGAMLVESAIPKAPEATLEDAMHGGEDYELLFTIPKRRRIPMQIAGVNVAPIGEIVRSARPAVRILSRGRWRSLAPLGWQHFA